MKLHNLSGCTVSILQELRSLRAATVGQLKEVIPNYTVRCISGALCRLETFGFVEKPERFGGPWEMTQAGRLLFDDAGDAEPVDAQTNAEPVSEPDTTDGTTMVETAAQYDVSQYDASKETPIANQLLHGLEIEVALDEVRNRLRTPLIPAQAQRVYREILEQLPPILCDALLPITRLVEAHNAH